MLTNIHDPPEEGNFCVDSRNTLKLTIVEDYNGHVGYVDKGDGMAKSYFISHCKWIWIKTLFFPLIYLKILNSQILLKCRGSKLSHRDFSLWRNIVELAGPWPCPLQTVGRPPALATRLGCLEMAVTSTDLPEMRMDCVVCPGHTKKMLDSDKVPEL